MTSSINLQFLLCWALLCAGASVFAGDSETSDATSEQSTSDESLLRSLLGDDESESSPREAPTAGDDRPESTRPGDRPANEPGSSDDENSSDRNFQGVSRLLDELEVAQTNLATGDTGDSTRTAQANAIAELDRLIDQARQQQQQSSKSSTDQNARLQQQQQPQPGQTPTDSGQPEVSAPSESAGVPNGSPRKNREGPAEESSDRVREDVGPGNSVREFRSGLVRDVWGHLPERLRDEMLNVGSDRYLPQYDSLVREYFESLARPRPESPPQQP